jgi:hypothetical protein
MVRKQHRKRLRRSLTQSVFLPIMILLLTGTAIAARRATT